MTAHRRFAPLAAVLLFAACGTGAGDLGPVATPPPTPGGSIAVPSPEATPGATTAPSGTGGAATTVRAFFYLGSFTGNAGLVPVLREVPRTTAVGAAAMTALLAGPNTTELSARPAMFTALAGSVRFLGLSIDAGTATVDLSREFETGADAGTLDQRIAQVVWTLTQFPSVTAVRFQLDGGSPTKVLAGLFDRTGTIGQLPAIWVERPAWGGVLANPGRVTGYSSVFEAAFRVQVLDGSGRSLADVPATASCGSGCWGTFDVTVAYTVGSGQWGTLRVYDRSAKDGSRQDTVDYRVWLTAG